ASRRSAANSASQSIPAQEGNALSVILSIPFVILSIPSVILSAAKDQVKSLSLAELAITRRTAQKTPKSASHTPARPESRPEPRPELVERLVEWPVGGRGRSAA